MPELTLQDTLKKMAAKVILLNTIGILPISIGSNFLKDVLEMTILHASGDESINESIIKRDQALDVALSMIQSSFSGPIHQLVVSLRDSTKNLDEAISNTISNVSRGDREELLNLFPNKQFEKMGLSLKPKSTLH
jgi:hypothetical protein